MGRAADVDAVRAQQRELRAVAQQVPRAEADAVGGEALAAAARA